MGHKHTIQRHPRNTAVVQLQPLRTSRTLSFPQTRCFGGRVKAGQGGGWGCGPEQLVATVPCALFTVDVSQWLVETHIINTHVDKIVGTPLLMKEKPTMVTEKIETDKSNNK